MYSLDTVYKANKINFKNTTNGPLKPSYVVLLVQGMNIVIDALVNDTTGTLLTGALEDNKCAIGLVLCKYRNSTDRGSRGQQICNRTSLM